MQEVQAEAVDFGAVLRESVHPGGETEVVVLSPIAAEVLGASQRHALRPVADGFRLRPPRPPQPVPQVGDSGLVQLDLERFDHAPHASVPGGKPASGN